MVESFPTPVKTSHLTLPAFRFLGRLQQSGRLLKVGDETNEVCVKTSPIPSLVSCFQRAVKKVPRTFLILNKVSEWFAAGWVAEFAEGFGFNLADAFTGYVKDLTNIF